MIVQIFQLFLTILAVMFVLSVAIASAWFTIKELLHWATHSSLRSAITYIGSAMVGAFGASLAVTVENAIDGLQRSALSVPLGDIGLMAAGFYLAIGALIMITILYASRNGAW